MAYADTENIIVKDQGIEVTLYLDEHKSHHDLHVIYDTLVYQNEHVMTARSGETADTLILTIGQSKTWDEIECAVKDTLEKLFQRDIEWFDWAACLSC